MDVGVFYDTAQNFAVYYIPGKAGWTTFSSSPKARLATAGSSLLTYTSSGGKIKITGINPEAVDTLFIPPTVDTLPVTSIGTSAFEIYPELTNVTIPSSVTSIASFAFYGSSRLTSVYFLGDAPSIGSEVFKGAPNGTIYYVQGTAGWSSSYGGLPTATWVPPPPSISVQPTSVTVMAESPATFSVSARGMEPLTYQWSKDSVNIAKATNHVFSLAAATAADAALYRVTVSNSAGFTASEAVQLTVKLPILLYSTSGNTITITGSNPQAAGDLVIPATINNLPVSSIGANAFINSGKLTSVTIPNSGTSIGTGAFMRCSGLTSVTIPNSVIFIGGYAFYDCSGLTSVTIPNSVTSIGRDAFNRCSGLTSVTIPDGVTSIGPSTFGGCRGLTSVTIPDSVTTIGDGAFNGCIGLTSVTIPDSVAFIASTAFSKCAGLTRAFFRGDAPNMGSSVFSGAAQNFAVYYIPGEAGWNTFSSNPKASLATAGSSLLTYTSSGGKIKITGINPEAVGILSIPPTVDTLPVTTIGPSAFKIHPGLTSVTIPSSVTSIASFAFSGSSKLTSVYFLGDAPSLGSEVFMGATNGAIYYIEGKAGWNSYFGGLPTATWDPFPIIAPSITVQPLPATVTAGSPVSFTVTSTDTTPLSYQWSKDAVNIAKATNQVFSLAAATATDAGLYQVTVSNEGGTVISQTARLTVTTPLVAPTITVQPLPLTVVSGSPAYFTVAVSGTGPLTYQWRKDSVNIAKGTNHVFSLPTSTGADAGLYQVTISNSGGAVVSQTARLTVNVSPIAPTIDVHPLPVTVIAGFPAYFAVVVTGTGPLFYQWSKEGLTLPEAAHPIFSLAKATTADAGLYSVTVSNSGGNITSFAARLTVNIPGLPTDNTLVLELSTDLGNPLWTPVATNYVSGSGPQRFYRLVPQ